MYPVGTLEDETTEEMNDTTYGPLKACLRKHALDAGLQCRPLKETLADIYTCYPSTGRNIGDLKTGMALDKRDDLVKKADKEHALTHPEKKRIKNITMALTPFNSFRNFPVF